MSKSKTVQIEDMMCYQTWQSSLKDTFQRSKSINKKNNAKNQVKQQQAQDIIAKWVKQIFNLQTNYKKISKQFKKYVEKQKDRPQVAYNIDRAINDEEDLIANQISQNIEEIVDLYDNQQAVDPSQITKLYQKIQKIRQAMPELQKFCKNSPLTDDEDFQIQNYQADSFLRQIFDSDHNKDNFVSVCRDILQRQQRPQDQRLRILIREILGSINTDDEDEQSEEQDISSFCFQDKTYFQKVQDSININQSQTNDTEEPEKEKQKKLVKQFTQQKNQQIQIQETQKKKKKRKNKKKKKQNKYFQVSQQTVKDVVGRLAQMQIDAQQRTGCLLQNQKQWLMNLKKRQWQNDD